MTAMIRSEDCGSGDFAGRFPQDCTTKDYFDHRRHLTTPYEDVECEPGGYFSCDGSRLHEPPKLSIQDQIQLARALQQKEHLALSVQEFELGLERVQKELTLVKVEIEGRLEEQRSLQASLDTCKDESRIGLISLEKLERHKGLIDLINREDILLNELEGTRRALASANIENQGYALEMNDRIEEIQRIHTVRKDYEYNCRLQRENTIRRNSTNTRRREILESATACEKYVAEKLSAAVPKPKLAKEAAEKLRSFRNKNLDRIAGEEKLAAAEEERRRARHKANLVVLKRELEEQREQFHLSNNIRKERARKMEKAEKQNRQEIIDAGGNPYLLERLADKERLDRLAEKKRQEMEAEAAKRLGAELRKEEGSEQSRLRLRQSLEEGWAAKAKEKQNMARRLERGYYEDMKKRTTVSCDFESGLEVNQVEKELFNFDLVMEQKGHRRVSPVPRRSTLEFDGEGWGDDETWAAWDGIEFEPTVKPPPPPDATPFFRFHPDHILFQDFEPFKIYRRKVTISNRSDQRIRFCFRELVDLDFDYIKPPIGEVVKVFMETPAPLYPGLTHEFYITFSPKSFYSWEGRLQFDSDLGHFSLPLKCSEKRFDPVLSTTNVRFSHVVVGTSASVKLKLINRGSLSGFITYLNIVEAHVPPTGNELTGSPEIVPAIEETRPERDDGAESERKIPRSGSGGKETTGVDFQEVGPPPPPPPSSPVRSILDATESTTGTGSRPVTDRSESGKSLALDDSSVLVTEIGNFLGPSSNGTFVLTIEEKTDRLLHNGELNLKVTYSPEVVGNQSISFEIGFDEPDIGPLRLDVEGTAVEHPFIATPLHVNMHTCVMNMKYQQPIEIRNHYKGKGIGKIVPKVPTVLKPFVRVIPQSATSLPGTANLFTVKFQPRPEILEQIEQSHIFDSSFRILDFPVVFSFESFPYAIPGPVTCTFQTILDTPEIQLDPASIDFGICYTTETVRKRIKIKSVAEVVQHFGFVDLPQWISVQPNYGFGTLLPRESREIDVLVSPPPNMVGKQQVTLKLRTLEKTEYKLSIKATGKLPTTAYTYSHILFPVTCIGSTTAAITEIYIKGTLSKGKSTLEKNRGNPAPAPGLSNQSTTFKFLVDNSFPITIAPSSGTIEPGKGQKVLVTFSPDLSKDAANAHFPILLGRKFQENLQNIQLELTTVNELLAQFQPPPTGRKRSTVVGSGGSGSTRPKSASGSSNSIPGKRLPGRKAAMKTATHRKISMIRTMGDGRSTIMKSPGHHVPLASGPVIHSFDDLQLIFSDGKVLVPNQQKELEQRKNFLMHALSATLDFAGVSVSAAHIGTLDNIRVRRDLMQNFHGRTHAFTIPCHFTLPDGKEEIQLLTLKCPTQKPDLVLLDGDPAVDFGGVEVGQKLIREINLYNTSIGILDLKMEGVSPYGPFTRVNALRRLAPNLVFTLRIKFEPMKAEQHYEETVMVCAGESRIMLTLIGEGVFPPPPPPRPRSSRAFGSVASASGSP